jgi:hypothetical protein
VTRCLSAPSLALLASLSCSAERAPAAHAPGTAGPVVANVTPPPGAALEQACMPTGPELCFNAVDDNCNGVIDEGCGEETGVLQFTIAWSSSSADVNLTLETPDHVKVQQPQAPPTPGSGCSLDRDCPRSEACRGQNVENIHCEAAEPMRGHYVVEITLARLNGAEEPVKVHFGTRLGGRTTGFDVDLSTEEAKRTFSFDVR